ncbi:MAG: hypothetical protein HY318_15990 [Armatimonadetes bacterium]|nr:hypothetical protein [Armatimonadota bacterium]
MKVGNTKDTLTLVELFNSLQSGIWSELRPGQTLGQSAGKPTISTQRRGLQREYLNVFINLLLQPASGTPEDARTLSWHHLKELQASITSVLRSRRAQLDTATLAHLEESRQRLTKALEMRMEAVVR